MAGETLGEFLDRAAARAGGAPAIIYQNREIAFRDLAARARRLAGGLAGLGVGRGDRVALWLPNAPAWLEFHFACARLGAIVVAVNTRYRGAEVEDIVARSGATALALWPGFKGIDFLAILADIDAAALTALETIILYDEGEGGDGAGDLLPGRRLVRYADLIESQPFVDDLADPDTGSNIFTTSGTTKAPKFVLHSHASLTRHAGAVAPAFGYDAADAVMYQGLPFCGVYGFCQAMASLAAARPFVLTAAFEAGEAADLIARHRVTHLNGSDEMFFRLFEVADGKGVDLSRLRHCGFAAFGHDPAATVAEGDRHGVALVGLYGMSEVQALLASRAPAAPAEDRARAGGVPVSPETRVRARDPETGDILPPGENGELEFKGPSLMTGYFGDDEATREAFREDGFVRSGDLGRTDPDGGFEFLTRMGDVLRLGGFLVSPAEISSFVESHPTVEACQVVGVAGAKGTSAVAFVVPAPGVEFSEAALADHCRQGMAKFKLPARFFAIDAFPVTESANGVKIRLTALRDMASARLGEGATRAPARAPL